MGWDEEGGGGGSEGEDHKTGILREGGRGGSLGCIKNKKWWWDSQGTGWNWLKDLGVARSQKLAVGNRTTRRCKLDGLEMESAAFNVRVFEERVSTYRTVKAGR